jgi:integrase
MPTRRLTKTSIDAISPSRRRTIFYDSELSGFGLRVEPSGIKTFIVRYRANGGGRGAPERLVKIGRFGECTLDQAKETARDMLASIRLGADPAADRRRRRGMPTFEEFAVDVLTEAANLAQARPREARLRPASIRNYRSLLKCHVGPAIGTTKIDAVTISEVQRLHRRLGSLKPATANRCLEFIGSIYKEAARVGILPVGTNPARGVLAFKENRCERFLSSDELARLGAAIRDGESRGIDWFANPAKKIKHVPKATQRTKLDPHAAAALRLLILTGARLREILHAKWNDIDFERGLLTVFGKTGRRQIFLPTPAVAILATLPRIGNFVIAGDTAGTTEERPRADLNRPWRAVKRQAGLGGVRLHDLRHSHAALAAAGGASLPIIGRLLGHSQPSTTQRYSHLSDDPLRLVSEKVAATATAAMERNDDPVLAPQRVNSHDRSLNHSSPGEPVSVQDDAPRSGPTRWLPYD